MVRIEVDRHRCEGYGFCEEQAPGLLHLDDEGQLIIDEASVGESALDAARSAIRSCPVAALKLVQ